MNIMSNSKTFSYLFLYVALLISYLLITPEAEQVTLRINKQLINFRVRLRLRFRRQ
jgi:hypothetical protein